MNTRVNRLAPWLLSASLAGCLPHFQYDEADSGDLSNDPNAPTPFGFTPGENTVVGQVTTSPPADTRDFITFSVPSGHALVALRLLRWVDLPGGGPGNRGFHALNSGPTSFIPGPTTEALLLGGDHIDPVPAGTDLLPGLADGVPAGAGFTLPLGPGTYSYVIQQTGRQVNGYTIQFVIGHPRGPRH